MLTIMTSGHLIRDPQTKQTKSGNDFITAMMVATQAEGQSQLINLSAFDSDVCRTLAGLRKGDELAITGKTALSVYQGKDGAQVGVQVTVSRILAMSETSAKPRPRQPRQPRADGRQFDPRDTYQRPGAGIDPDLNDEVPFG